MSNIFRDPTPAPWTIRSNSSCTSIVGGLNGECVAYNVNSLADQRLIAAAPEMLRLLTVISRNWLDPAEPDQNEFAHAMSEAEQLANRLLQES